MPFSVLKSVYSEAEGLAPNFAELRFGSTIAHCASTRRKLRGLCASRGVQGVRTAYEGWYLGWLLGSAIRSQRLPFYTGRRGVLNRHAGVSAAMISATGKRWQACAVRLCIKDR
jgi:hypothetical protein